MNRNQATGDVIELDDFVHKKISHIAEKQPSKIAIACGSEVLTYGELELLSNRLAHYLIKKGVAPESRVAVCIEPCLSLPVIILGILKSGGAYIHLSPTLPPARIETILNDAKPQLLITDSSFAHLREPEIELLKYDLNEWLYATGDDDLPLIDQSNENATYILYTSGSTGKPKGVVIEHRNLNYYLNWTVGEFAKAIKVKLPLTSSMSFAAGVTQFYSPLLMGYTMNILPPELITRPFELLKWYNAHPGYGLYCVPTLWNEILNWIEQNNDSGLAGPDCIILSGEAVSEKIIARTFKNLPHIKAWNLYGPTEAVANLSAGELRPGKKISIGKALPGTKLFIVKENGAEALPGEKGELLAAGDGIARGYLGLEDITAERFITFQPEGYGSLRVYKTGDIVRKEEDGEIVYVGRNDQQVKVRGYRIETMEVEQVIKQLDCVKQAVVKAYAAPSGSMLVAYVIPDNNNIVSVTSLRKELAVLIPDYMIPERWQIMDQFPKLANGKIDRGQLLMPGNPRPELGNDFVPPATADEMKMVHIFEKVLGISGIGADDNFFDLGGTSITVNNVIYEVKEMFGGNILFRSIFDYPTPKALLHSFEHNTPEDTRENTGNEQLIENKPIPLTPNQSGLWYLHQLNSNSYAYNIPYAISIRGTLNIVSLKLALQAVTDRYAALRSCVAIADGSPSLNVKQFMEANIGFVDLSYMNVDERIKHAHEGIELSATRPFDLLTPPLFRVHLYKIDDRQYVLGLIVHHIIFDGLSLTIFHKELLSAYDTVQNRSAIKNDPVLIPYQNFAIRYSSYLASREQQNARKFWQQKLSKATNQFILPHDFVSPSNNSEAGGRIEFHLDKQLKEKINAVNKKYGVTPYINLLSAFLFLVHKYNKQTDILTATAVANRFQNTFNSQIGFFTNTILIRAHLNPGMAFADFLRHIKDTCIDSFQYEKMPYSEQIRLLHEQGCVVPKSGVEIMFIYHEAFTETANNTLQTEVKELFNRSAKFPVFLECQDEKEGIKIALTYDKNLYHEQTIIQLMAQYTHLLNEIADDATQNIYQYQLESRTDKAQLVEKLSGAKKHYSDTLLLHKLFERIVDKYSNRIAIRYNGESFTYQQIDEWANRLANHLTGKGIKANEPIGIFMDHSAFMVTAILAVLKTGAHYIPLDPDYPVKRNIYVSAHSRLRVVLTNSKYTAIIPDTIEIIVDVDNYLQNTANEVNKRPDNDVTPDGLVYIMYTSGSTGNPKGVMVPHKGVCNYLLWMQDQFGVGTKDSILAKTSISFDVSVWELFLPLISGGKLILYDRNLMKAPEKIAEVINEESVNIVQFVPSGLKAFVDSDVLRKCNKLEKIFCGGEKMAVQLQDEVLKQFNGELHNLYGPTEASIFACHFQCSRSANYRSVPIGKPIPNSNIYILDDQMRQVPAGCVGNIFIYGDVLAKGYLYDEAQTGSSFINYNDGENEKIIYKTGDIGRALFNGNIEFHGRVDYQVKVRGYRIELGEIEQVLMQCPGVSGAVVVRKEINESDVRLMAYLVLNAESGASEETFRQYSKQNLPEYMQPSTFYFVKQIPVLPNGKTDVSSLDTYVLLNKNENKSTVGAFTDDIEKVLVKIWAAVLGKDDFKTTDNFMDAGGHSILLAKVCAMINEQLKKNYSLLDLFQYPSIESFAKHYREIYLNSPQIQSIVQDRIAKRKSILNKNKKL